MNSSQTTPEKKNFFTPKIITVLVLLAIALIFVFSNLQTGHIQFLGLRVEAPAWIWFLLLLAIGVVIGSIFPWFRNKKKK